jgi:hypothetical protein
MQNKIMIFVFFIGCSSVNLPKNTHLSKESKCETSFDCKIEEACVNGLCTTCTENNQCRSTCEYCDLGICQSKPKCCITKYDCENTEACINNFCTLCKEDSQCGICEYCHLNQCKIKENCCKSDFDCPNRSDYECQENRCINVCELAKCKPRLKCHKGDCFKKKCITNLECLKDEYCVFSEIDNQHFCEIITH